MDLNTKKEEFSYGYLQLLCATNGLALEKTGRAIDNTGIDVRITGIESTIEGTVIDVQVKCTSQSIEKEDSIKFPLTVKAYNKLRKPSLTPNKTILIVVIVPKNLEEWLVVENDGIILRKCGYWISLQNFPATKNKETITIEIPRENIITNKTLLNLVQQESKDRHDLIQMIKSKSNDKN